MLLDKMASVELDIADLAKINEATENMSDEKEMEERCAHLNKTIEGYSKLK